MRRGALVVVALTLAVSTVTARAALGGEPAPVASSAEPQRATPLSVRPSRPIELAPEPPRTRYGAVFVILALALGGGLFWYRRKAGPRVTAPRRTITVSARKALGMRSELLVVEIDGHGLLLGVTPGAIQRLAVLPSLEAEEPAPAEAEAAVEDEADADEVEPGFKVPVVPERRAPRTTEREARPTTSLPHVPATTTPKLGPAPAAPPVTRATRSLKGDLAIEEQVRGLLRRRA